MSDAGPRVIGFGGAVLEQLRWFGRRLWLWIAIVSVLTSVTSAWIIGSIPDDAIEFAVVLAGNAFHPLLVLVAVSWALSAWRDDPPRDRQYFWLHPVSRVPHVLARSVAGYLWLMAVVVVVIAATVVTAHVALGPAAMEGAARLWFYACVAITIAYFAASIAPLLANRPELWIVLVVAIVVLTNVVATIREIEWLKTAVEVFLGGSHSFSAALGAPGVEAARALLERTQDQAALAPEMTRVADARPGEALLIWLPISLLAWLGAARAALPR